MEWYWWVYSAIGILTAGAALGACVKNDEPVNFFGVIVVGVAWPVMWVACGFYALMKS